MLTLMYSSEEKCKDDEKQNLTSSFMFICGTKQLFSKPEFFPGNETCSHQFVWTTHLVCPVQSISCDIDGPNDTKINLGVLSGSNIDDDIIGITKFQVVYDCPVNSAACMLVSENGTEVSLGLGELRNPPYYNSTSKDIHLDYTMGSICSLDSSNHTHYSTRVIFRCDWGRRIFSMEYLGRLGCQYQFLVLTDAACPRKRTAITKDGCYISGNPNFPNEIIDFSQLSGSNSSLTFKDSDRNTFYINICDYLPGYDPFAAILKKPNGQKLMLGKKKVMSKGFLINEKLQLIYEHGEICPAEQNKTLSSVISFKCDPEIYPGYPSKIQDSDHCQINFEFPTALACKDLQIPYIYTAHSCKIYHAGRREFVDFSEVETHNAEFGWTLSPCQNPSCSVCGNGSSYGHIHSSQYDFHHESLIIENQGGSLCNDNATRRSSRIWFKCDRSLAKGEEGIVKLLYKNPCYAEFEWTMSLVCIPFEYEYENHFVEEVDSKSKYEEMIIIPVILIILSAIGGITYFKRKYGWNFFRTYRHRGFSPFVSYRRDLDTAYGDETLPSVPSSLSEDDNEQYKMI
ncbi:IGF2R [Lepeophtheirus salmonis]|uniref:IGF2R n=1 Tax=Lepeophtheirus salmonis TaxID=72036 RepID=A0A7R8H9Y5_LEPSM|nr:IGF2R [Lepeophtheirus salmonis]CAF2962021.1 IGF2R [Lepeophtheirus salmonis]